MLNIMFSMAFKHGCWGREIENIENIEKTKNPELWQLQIIYTCPEPKN